jgi:serine/threonine-protein kinase
VTGPSQSAEPPDPLIGAVLGEVYEIVRRLGAGGMGTVYEARHLRLPKRVAIKVVKRELAQDRIIFERFWREAQIAASLGNRHLVQVSDFNFLADGTPYMVMELLEGEDLSRRLAREGRLSPVTLVALFDDVVAGLADAHAHGIVHRDIKPENIFAARTDQGERVKVLDFGASKIRGGPKLTTDLTAIGTPWYMSPEQARALPDVDHRTDQYALATVMFEMLAGKPPFDGPNIITVMNQIVYEPPPRLRSLAPDAPEAMEAVLLKAMSKNPADRYPGVLEFWGHARAALGYPAKPRQDSPLLPPPIALPPPPAPSVPQVRHDTTTEREALPVRPRPAALPSMVKTVLIAAATAGSVLGVGVAAWAYLRGHPELLRGAAAPVAPPEPVVVKPDPTPALTVVQVPLPVDAGPPKAARPVEREAAVEVLSGPVHHEPMHHDAPDGKRPRGGQIVEVQP